MVKTSQASISKMSYTELSLNTVFPVSINNSIRRFLKIKTFLTNVPILS